MSQDEEFNRLRSLAGRQGKVLQSLLDSGGLRIADRVSALRHPGRDWSWRERVLGALGDLGPSDPAPDSPSTVEWLSSERCQIGGLIFQIASPKMFLQADAISMEGADFFLFKSHSQIRRYMRVFSEVGPKRIVELGMHSGGSAAFFFELASPQRMIGIELDRGKLQALHSYVDRREVGHRLRVHEGVDQSDRGRLREILADGLGSDSLDLVTDDCSHLYEPTRASFNELFPRLRPGGVYVIEDWAWLFSGVSTYGGQPGSAPLSRLIAELMIAVAAMPLFVAEVTIEHNAAFVTRGPAEEAPPDFDIAAVADPLARQLLASD